jgi:hypothetical protein
LKEVWIGTYVLLDISADIPHRRHTSHAGARRVRIWQKGRRVDGLRTLVSLSRIESSRVGCKDVGIGYRVQGLEVRVLGFGVGFKCREQV